MTTQACSTGSSGRSPSARIHTCWSGGSWPLPARRVASRRSGCRSGGAGRTSRRSAPRTAPSRVPEVGQRLGVGHVLGHRELVLGARPRRPWKRRLQVEDRPAVLDRHHPAGREAPAVADAVDLVEDRHGRIAGAQEVGVQRVHQPVRSRPCGRPPPAPGPPPGRRTRAGVLVGATPRNMFTSIASRSSRATRSSRAAWFPGADAAASVGVRSISASMAAVMLSRPTVVP